MLCVDIRRSYVIRKASDYHDDQGVDLGGSFFRKYWPYLALNPSGGNILCLSPTEYAPYTPDWCVFCCSSIIIRMSEVLYRKYRPKTFEEVVEQDEIVTTLMRSIKDKSVGHAYLFFGGRGTGKTTIARIFAQALGVKPVDLYEIDAASNTGVDDVRDLREAANTYPFESPYKVYILDEVHMLSKSAFNALLKTLEEPPQHVIFILATTEKDKVPETVISRCQSFTFKQPSIDALKKFVLSVAKKEGVTLDGPSAEIVAMFGDGSFRDSLSVLEKVLTNKSGTAMTEDEVAKIVGAPSRKLVNDVLESVATANAERGLLAIQEARDAHIDMKVYLRMIMQKLRAVMMLRYAPKMLDVFRDEFTPDDLTLISEYAKGKEVNSHVLMNFIDAHEHVAVNVAPGVSIEIALIRSIGEK